MEHNTKTPCEMKLMHDINTIVNTGIRRASTLFAVPRLYNDFSNDLSTWLTEVGCMQSSILTIAKRIWFAPTDRVKLNELVEPMVTSIWNYIFRKGKTKPYPTLNALLKVAHDHGSQAAICYLMQVAANYARDLQRRFNVRCAHRALKVSRDKNLKRRFTDPGDLIDQINRSPEEKMAAQAIGNSAMAQLGQKFPSDLVMLAKNAKMTREEIADYFAEGRVSELAEYITRELSFTAGRDCSPFLSLLRQKARTYVLPARLKGNRKALVSYLFRQTGGKEKDAYMRRGQACGL